MESLEKTFAELYKNLPHLPPEGRQWLARNVWWIALVGAVIGALGIIPLLAVVFGIGLIASFIAGPIGIVLSGTLLVAAIISMTYLILFTVITAMAVSPLKNHQKKGWDYVFIIMLLGLVALVLNLVFAFDVSSLLVGVLSLAIAGYFLFEIRDYFNEIVPITRKKEPMKPREESVSTKKPEDKATET